MLSGKRGRGRPRKVIKEEGAEKTEIGSDKPTPNGGGGDSEAKLTVPSSVAPSEQESSAIEGLLGLSELGNNLLADGTKRRMYQPSLCVFRE